MTSQNELPSDNFSGLPSELHYHIAKELGDGEVRNLSLVSHHLHDVLARDLLLKDLDHAARTETLLLSYKFNPNERAHLTEQQREREQLIKDHGLWFPDPWREGSLAPFVIRRVETSPDTNSITLHIYEPMFFRDNDEVEALDIRTVIEGPMKLVHTDGLGYESKDWDGDFKYKTAKRFKTVKYDDIVGSGRVLERLTPAVLRENWVCPDCSGRRRVCAGCGGMSMRYELSSITRSGFHKADHIYWGDSRWRDLFTDCGWPMPCPACLGFDWADEAKALWKWYQRTDDDQELVEFYAKVNAFLPAHERL